MILKDDTIFPEVCPPLLLALLVADQVYQEKGTRMVVTSLRDGRHSNTSLHYSGAAADLRIRGLPEGQPQWIVDEIRTRLNRHYDVILEADHIHLEWQPRRS